MQYKVHFWQLSNKVRFTLNNEFRNNLFESFKNLYDLADKLKIPYSYYKGLIQKDGKVAPNRSYFWKIREVK